MDNNIKLTRRRFLRAAAMLAGGGMGAFLYTWRWEPHWLRVVRRKLPLTNLPDRLVGTRLAHLTDLHIGPRVDDSYLIDTFKRVRRYAPEIVVYTGDFTSYEANIFEHASRMFPHLPLGTRATFGVLGNHDYGPGWAHPEVAAKIAALAKAAGVDILRNESAEIEGLQIVGCDDLWADRFEPRQALAAVDPQKASLVLSHNPDTADLPGWEGHSGWILAGHTHGGECKPPFLPPPLLPVRNRIYTSGEFALFGGRRMYINRGVGYLFRVRFHVRPEVVFFELARA